MSWTWRRPPSPRADRRVLELKSRLMPPDEDEGLTRPGRRRRSARTPALIPPLSRRRGAPPDRLAPARPRYGRRRCRPSCARSRSRRPSLLTHPQRWWRRSESVPRRRRSTSPFCSAPRVVEQRSPPARPACHPRPLPRLGRGGWGPADEAVTCRAARALPAGEADWSSRWSSGPIRGAGDGTGGG